MKSDISGQVSEHIHASLNQTWKALTTPEIIEQYFFGTKTITDWKAGSSIAFKGEWKGKTYEDKGTILDIVPNKILKYNYWSPMSGTEDRPENYMTLTYSLQEEEDGTTVTILQENIPDEQTKEHSLENWQKVLTDLKALLEKDSGN